MDTPFMTCGGNHQCSMPIDIFGINEDELKDCCQAGPPPSLLSNLQRVSHEAVARVVFTPRWSCMSDKGPVEVSSASRALREDKKEAQRCKHFLKSRLQISFPLYFRTFIPRIFLLGSASNVLKTANSSAHYICNACPEKITRWSISFCKWFSTWR